MRVLFVGPGVSGKYTSFHYSTDKKLRNGITRLGHHCVAMSDRDAAQIAFGIRSLGRAYANHTLLRIAESLKPDLVILILAHLISPKTIRQLRKNVPACRIANVEIDALTPRRLAYHKTLKGLVDMTFITSAGEWLGALREDGIPSAYLPNATDASIESAKVYDGNDFTYDMTYVASAPSTSSRWDLVNRVEEVDPSLTIGRFGAGKKRVMGMDYFDVLSSSCAGLNWSAHNHIELYASSRIAQLFGCGNLVCLYRGSGLHRFFTEEQALFFNDPDDLAQKLASTVRGGEWRSMAQAGQKRYRASFNETAVADFIVKRTMGEDTSHFEWSEI